MKEYIAFFVLVLVLIPPLVGISALIIMLVSGAIGHAFSADAFFISFWQSVWVSIGLTVLGSFFKNTTKRG